MSIKKPVITAYFGHKMTRTLRACFKSPPARKHLKIAIAPGAEDGVGPELFLRALSEIPPDPALHFIWCGDQKSLVKAGQSVGFPFRMAGDEAHLKTGLSLSLLSPIDSSDLLYRQAIFLERSVELALKAQADAIVTGPIEKAALAHLDAGLDRGQTEYLARHLGKDSRVFMSFMGGPFLLSLMTAHIPLKDVAASISQEQVAEHIREIARHAGLVLNKKIADLRISVLGINPHAGEAGLLGREEEEILGPAISSCQSLGLPVLGPLPADGFFAYFHRLDVSDRPDVVVAIYHDQGLIPYKLLAEGEAVNVTLGLKIPRTSPAHGTAKELFQTGRACHRSTQNALRLAIELAQANRAYSPSLMD